MLVNPQWFLAMKRRLGIREEPRLIHPEFADWMVSADGGNWLAETRKKLHDAGLSSEELAIAFGNAKKAAAPKDDGQTVPG